jgi:deoxyribodipyrimidine photo-lyase
MKNTMRQSVILHWFRQDLRLSDNPALFKAAKHGQVLPIYILDDESADAYAMGAASRWWLHHSLTALNVSLQGKLSVYRGQAKEVLSHLLTAYNVTAIYWNRCYEPWRMQRDSEIKALFRTQGIEVHSDNGSLLWEPWNVLKADATPYKVFTPFYRNGCLQAEPPRLPLSIPENLSLLQDTSHSMTIDSLGLLPKLSWDKKLASHWDIGERAAQARLEQFLEQGLNHYKEGRNFPAKPYVSRLSPHVHFGEISPNQAWYAAKSFGDNNHIDHFCSELGWREFSYSQLYYFPDLPHKNLQSKFDAFPWKQDAQRLSAWQHGQTGIPMVDAGMRELWQTGVMHNRVRMIVGSFLVKNLLLDWRHGERWFWDCLVDADLASNSASWQWIAGCGADAAPYFRIFNPVTQGQKFDADGEYVRRFLPELNNLPLRYLFSPWEAPAEILKNSGIQLGKDYPNPMVDLKLSRQDALTAFASLKTEYVS